MLYFIYLHWWEVAAQLLAVFLLTFRDYIATRLVTVFMCKWISSWFFKTEKVKTVLRRWVWHWLSLWLCMSHKARLVSVFACFHSKSHPSTGIKMNCNFLLCLMLNQQLLTIVLQDKSTEFLFSWSLVALEVPGAPANPEGKAQPIRNLLDWHHCRITTKIMLILRVKHQRAIDNLGEHLCRNQDKPKQNTCLNKWELKLNFWQIVAIKEFWGWSQTHHTEWTDL